MVDPYLAESQRRIKALNSSRSLNNSERHNRQSSNSNERIPYADQINLDVKKMQSVQVMRPISRVNNVSMLSDMQSGASVSNDTGITARHASPEQMMRKDSHRPLPGLPVSNIQRRQMNKSIASNMKSPRHQVWIDQKRASAESIPEITVKVHVSQDTANTQRAFAKTKNKWMNRDVGVRGSMQSD